MTQTEIVEKLTDENEKLKKQLQRQVNATENFLSYLNPHDMAEDKSRAWLSAHDQCFFSKVLLESV